MLHTCSSCFQYSADNAMASFPVSSSSSDGYRNMPPSLDPALLLGEHRVRHYGLMTQQHAYDRGKRLAL